MIHIKTQYPKSYELVKEYINNKFNGTINQEAILGSPGWQELIEGLTEEMLKNNPRFLYDFFDEKGIIISVCKTNNGTDRFTYYSTKSDISWTALTRKDAEALAFGDAFKVLENQLL